jgi:hypothetical protein
MHPFYPRLAFQQNYNLLNCFILAMKRKLTTISPIVQKCTKLPLDQKLVSKLCKFGVVLQEEDEEVSMQTTIMSIPPVISMESRLPRDFFNRHVVTVAKDLLGKTLNFGSFQGLITETEAYGGLDDEASHSYNGPTPRYWVFNPREQFFI